MIESEINQENYEEFYSYNINFTVDDTNLIRKYKIW